jgi:hypothetical protein
MPNAIDLLNAVPRLGGTTLGRTPNRCSTPACEAVQTHSKISHQDSAMRGFDRAVLSFQYGLKHLG